jgi:hypothetical protein
MGRRRIIRWWICAALVGAVVAVPQSARAAPAPFGSEALYRWLASTAAAALKASEATNDLRPGGLLALNRSAKSGLAQVDRLTPDWLGDLDPHFLLRNDLTALYGVRARRAVYESSGERLLIDTFGDVTIDQAGRTSTEIGFGLDTDLQESRLAIDLATSVEREWLSGRARYIAKVGIDWWRFSFKGSAFNDATTVEPSGALYEERLLDGMDFSLETGVPVLPWLTIGTRQSYRAPITPHAEARRSFRHCLRLRPLAGLQIEAGTEAAGSAEARWFGSFRYVLKLGG